MRLSETQGDGATLRDHLLAAAAATGRRDPLLEHRLPAAAGELWNAFAALATSRPGGAGIPASEIVAWQALHGVRFTPWEVDTLEALDRACAAQLRRQAARRRAQ